LVSSCPDITSGLFLFRYGYVLAPPNFTRILHPTPFLTNGLRRREIIIGLSLVTLGRKIEDSSLAKLGTQTSQFSYKPSLISNCASAIVRTGGQDEGFFHSQIISISNEETFILRSAARGGSGQGSERSEESDRRKPARTHAGSLSGSGRIKVSEFGVEEGDGSAERK
jgi:hypothetical protein